MRTTIEMPDALFRRTKAVAALRGTSLKSLIVRAVEAELDRPSGGASETTHRVKLPLIRRRGTQKLDLSKFDFDDLLT